MSPERAITRGTAEKPETFFTHREACNPYYDSCPKFVEKYYGENSTITRREYHLFSYYRDVDAIMNSLDSFEESGKLNLKFSSIELALHLTDYIFESQLYYFGKLVSDSIDSVQGVGW